jgi:uncharacterized membrane protein (DUF2068 family)
LTSRFKIKRRDGLLLAVFYAVVGIGEVAVFISSSFMPMAGVLAVLSFIAAYGLFFAHRWAVWFAIGLFFPQFVFGLAALSGGVVLYSFLPDTNVLLLNIALGAFVLLSFISFVYVAAKRKTFE